MGLLSEVDWSLYISKKLEKQTFKKNTLIIKAGDVENHQSFSVSSISFLYRPLMIHTINAYYGADSRVDISKARTALGYNPISPTEAIKNTLIYLAEKEM